MIVHSLSTESRPSVSVTEAVVDAGYAVGVECDADAVVTVSLEDVE